MVTILTCFSSDVCKEEIWRLPESPKTRKNLLEFNQKELATLFISEKGADSNSRRADETPPTRGDLEGRSLAT